MQVEKIDPIRIKYEGLDADRNIVELESLASSLRGASRLLVSSGQVALTGRYSKRDASNEVRAYALPPQAGSYDIWVMVQPIFAVGAAIAVPMLPYIDVMVRTAATKATEALVNATVARWSGRSKEMDQANQVAVKALEEMGHTSRAAIAMAERVALSNHPAAKLIVQPIGTSAQTLIIGHQESGAFSVNADDRAAIEHVEPVEIGSERVMTLTISELDLVTKTCKVTVVGDDSAAARRVAGQITDPQIAQPNNPYSSAFDSQKPINVKCKPQYTEGELERLFISDIAA
ncbi:hypothetical protein [Mesorhizobium sp. BE184]|uniref:DUF7946 domain-containing protein n=1 Tax=Mesorhizobium sp. BE184 TaxID=2817714 RepID=UPI00286070A2|nr:hypothetical protein [Mesorhizobium sp. BE184]MDR7034506.1 hypothetical protein [Mesorhizobium sp. BE184]